MKSPTTTFEFCSTFQELLLRFAGGHRLNFLFPHKNQKKTRGPEVPVSLSFNTAVLTCSTNGNHRINLLYVEVWLLGDDDNWLICALNYLKHITSYRPPAWTGSVV